jgi:hypothetical protein
MEHQKLWIRWRRIKEMRRKGGQRKGKKLSMLAHWFDDGDAKKAAASANSGEELL